MKLFKLKGISKKYALRAAQYRRVANGQKVAGLAFDEAALRELHDWESRGIGSVDKSRNGFAYGKWCVDLSVSMWVEDLLKGNFCKAEFLKTRLQKLHNKKKLEAVIPDLFFPYAIALKERAREHPTSNT
jgi:hypothetical protein